MNNIVKFPLLVFVLSFAVLWLSTLVGDSFRKWLRPLEEEERHDFGVIQAATLTLLGLIIGFTFSMAVSRYDQRKNYEAAEANAIGTEYVRADMLSAADAARVRELLKNYLDQPAMWASFGRSTSLLLNCRTSYGPPSRFALRRSRHPWSPSPFRV
jgi:hypothetical protein